MGKGNRCVADAARCRKVELPGGVTVRICFWCDAVASLTRDHVVPIGAGGPKHGANVVPACRVCQRERAALVSQYAVARDLRTAAPKLSEKHLRRRVAKQRRKQDLKRSLLAKWVALETERWGSSPSGDMDLSLPPLPEERAACGPPVAATAPAESPPGPRPLGAWELD